jgi:hypothetical protein
MRMERVRKALRAHESKVDEDDDIMEEDLMVNSINAAVTEDFDTDIMNWQNERDEYLMKITPRILSKYHKKLKCGLKLVIGRICQIFQRINNLGLNGKAKEEKMFFQEAYKQMIFLLEIHISEKIGKEIKNFRLCFRGKFRNNHNREDLSGERIGSEDSITLYKCDEVIKSFLDAKAHILDLHELLLAKECRTIRNIDNESFELIGDDEMVRRRFL